MNLPIISIHILKMNQSDLQLNAFSEKSTRSCLPNSLNRFVNHNKLIQSKKTKQIKQAEKKGRYAPNDFNYSNSPGDNNNNNNNNPYPYLNFLKGAVLGVKEQRLGIKDKI